MFVRSHELRPAANTSRPPGAWPPGPERSPTFVRNDETGGEYDRLRKARPDAEGERRNGAPVGATSSQEGVHIRIGRAGWRAVPSLRKRRERIETNLGRVTRRENEGGCTQ